MSTEYRDENGNLVAITTDTPKEQPVATRPPLLNVRPCADKRFPAEITISDGDDFRVYALSRTKLMLWAEEMVKLVREFDRNTPEVFEDE